MDELLYFGGAVKTLDEQGKVGGYLVRFSSASDPDITGARDFFTPDTDFWLEDAEVKRAAIYDHGLDSVLKRRKLGVGTIKVDEVGVWMEAQLELRDEYERAVFEMAKAGKLGWSSGSAPHLVERKRHGNGAHEVTSWPIVEASLTPTPAEPRNGAVSLKSYATARAESASKNLFTEALSERHPALYELCETLQSVIHQLQWIAQSTRGTGVEVNLEEQLDAALSGFTAAMREAALRLLQPSSTKSADAGCDISGTYAKAAVSIPLATHSKAVRDAARGLLERCSDLHAKRIREGKSRTLNETHTDNLETIASELEQTAKAVRGLTCDVTAQEQVRRARVDFQRSVARSLGVRPS